MKKWYYGTGKKKTAIAKIFIKKKPNKITINNKNIKNYFKKNIEHKIIFEPLNLTNNKKLRIKIKIKGGGVMSQILAIKHGISRALLNYNKNLKKILSKNKLLTRDSRIVERKKLGYKKSRKKGQFSKR